MYSFFENLTTGRNVLQLQVPSFVYSIPLWLLGGAQITKILGVFSFYSLALII